MKAEHPWNIHSIYDLQYFNCPSCPYKSNIKQEFVNHALEFHPEAEEYLRNINDGSLHDVEIPFDIKHDVKHEFENESDFPPNELDIKLEEGYNDEFQNSPQDDKYWVNDIKDVSNENDYQDELDENPLSKDNKCETCGKVFSLQRNLKFHIYTIHEGNKDYKCESCEKSFTTSSGLKGHVEKCGSFEKQECDICGKLVEQRLMEYHKIRVHIKPHKCNTCGKKFGVASVLKQHVNKHHGEGRRKCPHCEKTFEGKTILNKHIRKNHQALQKVQCSTCGKTVLDLEKHLMRNHGAKENLQCGQCGKKFDNRIKLASHEYSSHTERIQKQVEIEMVKCDLCEMMFRKNYLKWHVKEVHDKIKDYVCDTCGMAFTQKSSLIKHSSVHSGIRAYKCDLCSKTYTQSCHLNTHKKTVHEGRRDHICSHCGKAFGVPKALKLHIDTVHLGIKEWKCNICTNAYGQSHELKKHLVNFHKKEIPKNLPIKKFMANQMN